MPTEQDDESLGVEQLPQTELDSQPGVAGETTEETQIKQEQIKIHSPSAQPIKQKHNAHPPDTH